ncbi:MAG: hypothetical protein GC168_12565 [Candidatus Hydrogenedens sp.]|nr:hypothetical protein [Candidatus Hydrogenedens sp.]
MVAGVETCGLTPAEQHQIERHKYYMSQRLGYDVGMEAAKRDWLSNHAATWRKRRQEHMLCLQRAEIAKYRWIRSEQEHRDMGREAAMEWVQKHAAAWRHWYEMNFLDI